MPDPTPPKPPLEDRVAELEAKVRLLTVLMTEAFPRVLALTHLLHEKGLLDRAEVAARVRAHSEAAATAVELGPEYETFRRWRRELEGRDVPPEDRERG